MEGNVVAFTVACKQFFGMLPGQNLGQFLAECKALTQAARQELAELLTVRMHELGMLPVEKTVIA